MNGQAFTLAEALVTARGLPRLGAMAALAVAGSAFVALCAQFRIYLPFTPVPITGQTFAVLTVGGVLGSRLGAAALIVYWLEGIAGFKVFQGGNSGWDYFTGPTGGYIIGFIAAAYVTGWLAERGFDHRPWSLALAMAVGNVVIYVFGLPWLDHFYPGKALEFGLYPFVAGDAAKLLLAASLVPLGRSALARVPGIEEAVPRGQGRLALGQHRLVPLLYGFLGALIMVGAVLPWGLPAGGDDLGLTQQSGRVALAAGGASLLVVALPRLGLYLVALALVVTGVLLPFGVLPDAYRVDVGQEAGLIALAAGLLAVVGLAAYALPRLPRREAMRMAQFVVGTLAGYASF